MATEFDPIAFAAKVDLLTNPDLGLVEATDTEDLFRIRADESPTLDPDSGLVILTGPTGVGKDSIEDAILATDPRFSKVRTATARDRRPNEPEDAYTWMRPMEEGEDTDEYIESMVREHGLLEYDLHHGSLYGLPAENLTSFGGGRMGLMDTDVSGIRTYLSKLPDLSMLRVLICPEGADVMIGNTSENRDEGFERLAIASYYLDEAPGLVNFVYRNRREEVAEVGIQRGAAAILQAVDSSLEAFRASTAQTA
jgi:guanylate kinase